MAFYTRCCDWCCTDVASSKKVEKFLEDFFAQKVLIINLKEDKIRIFQGVEFAGAKAGIRVKYYETCKKQKPQKAAEGVCKPKCEPA